MIDLDEVMRRKDMRTVSGGEIKCLFHEIERLRAQLAAAEARCERYAATLDDIGYGTGWYEEDRIEAARQVLKRESNGK